MLDVGGWSDSGWSVVCRFLFMIEHVMPLCLTISWVYTVAMLVQSIVYEKEQRLKEVQTLHSLSHHDPQSLLITH